MKRALPVIVSLLAATFAAQLCLPGCLPVFCENERDSEVRVSVSGEAGRWVCFADRDDPSLADPPVWLAAVVNVYLLHEEAPCAALPLLSCTALLNHSPPFPFT